MIEILAVGDVHGLWDEVDEAFLENGSQSAVVFVGDFGDEDRPLVRRVGSLQCRKYVVLGNHDAWFSMDGSNLSSVREQIESLGESEIGFGGRALDEGIGLVGGRPFSWGGSLGRFAGFYRGLYQIDSEEDSAERIRRAAESLGDLPLLVVAHNGPIGLGEGRDAIYGVDFRLPFADHGDRDLRMALDGIVESGRVVLGTIAGHMHSRLFGGGSRKRVALENDDEIVHLNVASVPRHRRVRGSILRHFTRVSIEQERIVRAEDIWVDERCREAECSVLWER